MDCTFLSVAAIETRARLVRTRTAEQREIVWRVWDETPGGKVGVTFVLLHGSYGSWTHWHRVIALLAPRYRIVAPDMPGFGDSDDAPVGRSPPEFARLLRDGLEAGGAALLGATSAVVVGGFSLGAVYAGWLARALVDHPLIDPLALHLVLASPGGLGTRTHPLPALTRIARGMSDSERLAVHQQNLAQAMFGEPSNIDLAAVKVQDSNVARARFRGTFTSRSDFLLEVLPTLPMPLLAVWGDRDAFDPDVMVRVAAVRSVRPDARVAVVPQAGHWVIHEAATTFVQSVTEWINGQYSPHNGINAASAPYRATHQ